MKKGPEGVTGDGELCAVPGAASEVGREEGDPAGEEVGSSASGEAILEEITVAAPPMTAAVIVPMAPSNAARTTPAPSRVLGFLDLRGNLVMSYSLAGPVFLWIS